MAQLEERKKEIEEQFKKLEEQRKLLVEQGAELQRKVSEIQAEQLRLQGSFREVNNLLGQSGKNEGTTEARDSSLRKNEEQLDGKY